MLKIRFRVARWWNFKTLSRFISLSLLSTFFITLPVAFAADPVISTKSTIANGAESPPVFLDGVGFAADNDRFDFIVDVGTTGLEYDSVAFVDDSHMRFNFHGKASAGTITIQADASAFSPIAIGPSNTISIAVPVPLISQNISFVTPAPMRVKDVDQVPKATSSSGLTVVLTSNTPSKCTIDFLKIHAVAAGICSITATAMGNSIYSQAIPVTRSFTVLALATTQSNNPEVPVDEVTNFGSAAYDPTHTHTDYVSVLVGKPDSDPKKATLVKLLVPPGMTSTPAVFLISPFSSEEETAAGYFIASIKMISSTGDPIAKLKKPIEINIPAGAVASNPSWSLDGQIWYKLKRLETEVLPADYHAGYFIEKDGRIAILTDYLMLFGHRKLQEQLRISSPVLLTKTGTAIQISSTGGSGIGETRFYTRTQDVCTITASGLLTGLQEGKCIIAATKEASGIYSNAISSAIYVYIQPNNSVTAPSVGSLDNSDFCQEISHTVQKNSSLIYLNLCNEDAFKTAYLEVGTKSSSGAWSYVLLGKQKLDGNGATMFTLSTQLRNGQTVRIKVNGKIEIELTIKAK